jgi:hypothetical protein
VSKFLAYYGCVGDLEPRNVCDLLTVVTNVSLFWWENGYEQMELEYDIPLVVGPINGWLILHCEYHRFRLTSR